MGSQDWNKIDMLLHSILQTALKSDGLYTLSTLRSASSYVEFELSAHDHGAVRSEAMIPRTEP